MDAKYSGLQMKSGKKRGPLFLPAEGWEWKKQSQLRISQGSA